MPGTRTTVADLCQFGMAACDEGRPGFVNASVRTVTNARQVGMRMQSECTGTHRHAHVDASNTSENMEQTGSSAHQVARAMEEQFRENQQQRGYEGLFTNIMSPIHSAGKISCITEEALMYVTSILQDGLIAGGKDKKEGRHTVFFTPWNPRGDEAEEEFENDLSRPRRVHFKSWWKPHQDAVHWIHLARAQEKGLQFWADKVSRHYCLRFSAGGIHRKNGIIATRFFF